MLLAQVRKRRVLGEETVARVDRLRLRCDRRADDALLIQVAVLRRGLADADGLVCERHMDGFRIRLRIDRDGADAHLLAGADDAHRDLPAVCNE